MPYAFTESGIAMLSGVLRSQQAVNMNIQIMRAYPRSQETHFASKTYFLERMSLKNLPMSKIFSTFARSLRATQK